MSELQDVIALGVRASSLVAIRDRLAEEANDTLWTRHKDECRCVCGMGDGRLLVAILKELRAVIDEIDALPGVGGGSRLDDIAGSLADELAPRREVRRAAAPHL